MKMCRATAAELGERMSACHTPQKFPRKTHYTTTVPTPYEGGNVTQLNVSSTVNSETAAPLPDPPCPSRTRNVSERTSVTVASTKRWFTLPHFRRAPLDGVRSQPSNRFGLGGVPL